MAKEWPVCYHDILKSTCMVCSFPEQARELVDRVIEACAELALAQPYYPDTKTGRRQQWVKEQIAAAIRALDRNELLKGRNV